jgi:primosomal replication protein N
MKKYQFSEGLKAQHQATQQEASTQKQVKCKIKKMNNQENF